MRSDYKELLTWFNTKLYPEYLKILTGKSNFCLNKSFKDLIQEIKFFDIPEYKIKKSFLKYLGETIWVPRHILRGYSYSETNFEKKLDQNLSKMGLSTIVDLIYKSPILFYFTKTTRLLSISIYSKINYLINYSKYYLYQKIIKAKSLYIWKLNLAFELDTNQ